jgi:hypothetical protein
MILIQRAHELRCEHCLLGLRTPAFLHTAALSPSGAADAWGCGARVPRRPLPASLRVGAGRKHTSFLVHTLGNIKSVELR